MVPVPKVPKYCNVWLACTSCFLPHDITIPFTCSLWKVHMISITDFKNSKTTQLIFPVNFSLHSSVSGALQDLLSCTAGSQHALRWWQHTSINLTNLVQHAVCNYFPLSSWFFPQPIFILIYMLVKILLLKKTDSPQAFHYVAAAAVTLVTKKNLTLCDNGIWITIAKYIIYINLIALFYFSWRGKMWGKNHTVHFMLHYSVILDPKISTIPILVMNGM